MMVQSRRNMAVNIALAAVSLLISSTVGYYGYNYLQKMRVRTTSFQTNSDYELSGYNRKGLKIKKLTGTFKLVLDPFTIFNNYPNQSSKSYSINRYGFRDGYTSEKPYTAMVIGGSAAFSWLLDDNEQTFASQLSRSNPKYNVLNSAVVAFLSGQELAQMVNYLDDFHSNFYIVFDGWNDIHDPYMFTKTWPVKYNAFGFQNVFINIEFRLADYYRLTEKEKNSYPDILEPMERQFTEQEYFQEILKTYTRNVGKMHAYAVARSAKFLLVFQPELTQKKLRSATEQSILTGANQRPYEYHDRGIPDKYKRLIEEAKKIFIRQHITFLDINDEPDFRENPETLFFDVIHPNARGHEIIGAILNRTLLERF
jgi:lysophospholipase L1-like esterase